MLEGIPFDIIEGGNTHHYVTDPAGNIRICFPGPTVVMVREQPRQVGGSWYTTTDHPSSQNLGCAGLEMWIGNAQVSIPKTGRGPR
jgi:hypothetical protein